MPIYAAAVRVDDTLRAFYSSDPVKVDKEEGNLDPARARKHCPFGSYLDLRGIEVGFREFADRYGLSLELRDLDASAS